MMRIFTVRVVQLVLYHTWYTARRASIYTTERKGKVCLG